MLSCQCCLLELSLGTMNSKFAIILLVAIAVVLTTEAKSYRDKTKVRRPGLEDVRKPVLEPEAGGLSDAAAPRGEMTGNIPDTAETVQNAGELFPMT